jgi:hypothetical protein
VHYSLIDDLMRTAERNFRLSSFSMHCDHSGALMPLPMFAMIDAAAPLYEPFSECAAFHLYTTAG